MAAADLARCRTRRPPGWSFPLKDLRHRLEPRLLALLAILAAALWVFIGIAGEMTEGDTRQLDKMILLAMRVAGHPETPLGPAWLQNAARDITALGSMTVLGLLVLAAIAFLLLAGRRAPALFVLLATTGGTLASTLLKQGFDRPRPQLFPHGDLVVTASFPSGHAMLSTVVYLTLGALIAETVTGRRLKIYLMALSCSLAALVGISRVYLGVHWPTDVIAGWAAGAAWALLWWLGAEWLSHRAGDAAARSPSR